MQATERKVIHDMLINIEHCVDLLRSEHDHIHAHNDSNIRHELKQIHPNANVHDHGRLILLLVLTHALKLDANSKISSQDGEKSTSREGHREKEDPTQLHEQLIVLWDEIRRHIIHKCLKFGLLVLLLIDIFILNTIMVSILCFLDVLDDALLSFLENLRLLAPWFDQINQVHNYLLKHEHG